MKSKLPFFAVIKLKLVVLAITILSSNSIHACQLSRLIVGDTVSAFAENLRILQADDATRIKRRSLTKGLRKRFQIKGTRCANGFIRDGQKYIFFHTNIRYPREDELSVQNIGYEITGKRTNSHFLRSGYYIRKGKGYYVLEKSVVTKKQKEHLVRFIFFELSGQVAIFIYECDKIELFEQLPLEVAFLHQGNELMVPISQLASN
jgi:hypothetical protein